MDAQTFAGNTALHTASGCQMEDIVSLLLEFHADRMLKNVEGDLALPDASTVRISGGGKRTIKFHITFHLMELENFIN